MGYFKKTSLLFLLGLLIAFSIFAPMFLNIKSYNVHSILETQITLIDVSLAMAMPFTALFWIFIDSYKNLKEWIIKYKFSNKNEKTMIKSESLLLSTLYLDLFFVTIKNNYWTFWFIDDFLIESIPLVIISFILFLLNVLKILSFLFEQSQNTNKKYSYFEMACNFSNISNNENIFV